MIVNVTKHYTGDITIRIKYEAALKIHNDTLLKIFRCEVHSYCTQKNALFTVAGI